MYYLGIEQVKSNAYHPKSQGALERFHKLSRAYCVDTEKEWDEGAHLVLVAVRESHARFSTVGSWMNCA